MDAYGSLPSLYRLVGKVRGADPDGPHERMQQPLHLLPVIGGLLSPVVLLWAGTAQTVALDSAISWTSLRRPMSASRLGCTRVTSRRVPCTVRGCIPCAGLGVLDFTGERTSGLRAPYGRGLAVTVPETPHWLAWRHYGRVPSRRHAYALLPYPSGCLGRTVAW